MEHAGNISYPLYAIDGSSTYETLFAHELSHHWFGNLVTTNTAVDMWLNEGWASYCEALFLECVYGKEAYDKEINNELFEVLRWAHVRDGAYLPVSGVPLAQTYGTHVYTKGSLMAHSLRVLVNNDTAFFNTLKSYFEKYKFKVASSIDFQNHFEKRFGSEIIDFFNSYIFDKGHTDLQLIRLDNNIKEKNCEAVFKLMSRHKTVLPDVVWAYVSYNLGVQWNEFLLPIYKNKLTGDYILQISIGALLVSNLKIGTNQGTMNGATTHREWVKGTTPKTLSNALLIITPQINPDSAFVFIQHHFAQPSVNQNQLPIGIRISSERYWNIDGLWNSQFRATAFFNYDGSTPSSKNGGFLDNELIKGTEDSLVLLYRPNAETAFVVETDLTFQPGSNKADKTGRFWVNNLKKGDYVFGYKDISAAINNIQDNQRTLKLYPNPTEGNFTVEFPPRHQDGTIKVIDMKGALILESKFVKSDLEIKLNTSSWNKGNYILIFEDDRGKLTENFIVK
jgi:aminopeptidase N